MSRINTDSGISLNVQVVLVNGVDISNFLASGSKVGWYDVSKDSGRDVANANGDMILNVINDKYRLDLVTRPLTDEEVGTFYSEIKKAPTMNVTFRNPFENNQMTTIRCYRGDRSLEMLQPYGGSLLFNQVSQALIEL